MPSVLSYDLRRRLEVIAYERFGRHPERINRFDGYVVGDFSWNQLHPDKPEFIESQPWFQEERLVQNFRALRGDI